MTLSSKLDGPVLITGASGFVGSHVVRKLVSDGARVHALVRKTSNLWRIQDILHDITLEYADLADSESIAQAITKVKPKGIFHLGVSNVVSGLGAKNETIIQTNALGTVALLDAASAASFDFFVMTGSFLEYGFKDHPVREDELCEPGELYGVSKLAGTLYGAALGAFLLIGLATRFWALVGIAQSFAITFSVLNAPDESHPLMALAKE